MAVDNNMLRYVTLQCLTLRHITAPTAQDNSAGKMMTVDEREKRRKREGEGSLRHTDPGRSPNFLDAPEPLRTLTPLMRKEMEIVVTAVVPQKILLKSTTGGSTVADR